MIPRKTGSRQRPANQSFSVGLPLYEEVKKTIYGYWCDANEALTVLDRRRVMGVEEAAQVSQDSRFTDGFRVSVMQLFRAVYPKIKNHSGEQECVKKLLNNYGKYAFPSTPYLFTLTEALDCFKLLSEFLELNGITHYEIAKSRPDHAAIEELE